jgi:glycosyltransferase involved in cell wall biosynthesis
MNKKMKILIITHSFPTKHNPIGSIFLLNQLKELKKFCDIKIIFPYAYVPKLKFLKSYKYSDVSEYEKIEKLEVFHPKYLMLPRNSISMRLLNYILPLESVFSYMSSKKIAKKIVKDWNPDIIHLHGPLSESLIGKYLKKQFNKPSIVTVYGEDITKYAKIFPSNIMIKSTLNHSDVIIVQSKFMINEIKNIKITGKNFQVVPMGADSSIFKPENKTEIREKLKLPNDRKMLLFVGHLCERKGVKYLLQSVNNICKSNKNILCVIIGSGAKEEELIQLAKNLKISDKVLFLGNKRHEEVVHYINASDIVVLPSLNEGLPVILCESLMCGRPIVATSVAGTPELVTKDVGYLVKPKDVIDLTNKIELALNKKWNQKDIEKVAKKYSVSNSVKKLLVIYKKLLE